jgi:hypothetical protein
MYSIVSQWEGVSLSDNLSAPEQYDIVSVHISNRRIWNTDLGKRWGKDTTGTNFDFDGFCCSYTDAMCVARSNEIY